MLKIFFTPFILLLFSSCSTTPELKLDDVDKALMPAAVLASFPANKSSKVMWGGIIVSSQNLKKGSLLEVLAYPLSTNHEPDTQKKPLGRFFLEHSEYLETVNYAAGRIITAVGPVIELRKGVVGEAEYDYPVITAEQLHLWPTEDQKSDTRFHFGIGVMFSN